MNKGGMSRREFLRLSAAGVTGLLVASCAPRPTEVPPTEVPPTEEVATVPPPVDKVHVDWWYTWSGPAVVEALQAVADRFNAKSDTIHVEGHSIPWEEVEAKLLTAIAGGEPPDIAACISYVEFWARGAVYALDDLIAASEVIDKDDFLASAWRAAMWQGKTYGVPHVESYLRFALVYNEDLVKGAGLDPDSPPQTWDEAFEWHKAITKFDEAGNLEILGFDPMDAMGGSGAGIVDPLFWPQSFGFEWWLPDESKFNFDNPLFVEALATIKRFYDYVGVEKLEGFRSSYGMWCMSPTSGIPAGVQAMVITGYWAAGSLKQVAPDKKFRFTWAPTSSERKGTKFQSTGGHYGSIPIGGHLEEAFKFVEYTTTEEACQIIFEGSGFLGPRLSYLEKLDTSEVPGLEFFFKSATEADEMNAGLSCPLSAFTYDQWVEAVDAVNFGDKTPEQAAQDMQEACTKELRRQFPELT